MKHHRNSQDFTDQFEKDSVSESTKHHAPDKDQADLAVESTTTMSSVDGGNRKTDDQLVSEERILKGYHTFHCFKEFFQDDFTVNFAVTKLEGSSNLGFFCGVFVLMVMALSLNSLSVYFGSKAFYSDYIHCLSLESNELIQSNIIDLTSHFGDKYKDGFRRNSDTLVGFVFTAFPVFFVYFIQLGAFLFVNSYRVRILFNGFYHMLVIILEIVWITLLYYSVTEEAAKAVAYGESIRTAFANAGNFTPKRTQAVIVQLGTYVGKLVEPDVQEREAKIILEYCGHSLSDIPEPVLELLQEFNMCPDNESKYIAMYLNITALVLHSIIFTISLVWRCSAIDNQCLGDSHHRKDILPDEDEDLARKEEDSKSSSTDSLEESSSSSDSEEEEEEIVNPEQRSLSEEKLDNLDLFYAPDETIKELRSRSMLNIYERRQGLEVTPHRTTQKKVLVGKRAYKDTRRASEELTYARE